jgi:hypothetical protein
MTYDKFNKSEFLDEYMPVDVEDGVVKHTAKVLLSAWFPTSYPVGDDARKWAQIACDDVECVLDALPNALDAVFVDAGGVE